MPDMPMTWEWFADVGWLHLLYLVPFGFEAAIIGGLLYGIFSEISQGLKGGASENGNKAREGIPCNPTKFR